MACSICMEDSAQWVVCHNCFQQACEQCTFRFSKQSHKARCTLCGVRWIFSEQVVCRTSFKEVLFEHMPGTAQLEQCATNPAQVLKCVNQFLDDDEVVKHRVISCIRPACIGVVNNQNFCITCLTTQCHICNALEETHICNVSAENDFAYAASGCLPCPNCFCLVAKGDGCMHVTCEYCHVPFTWDGSKPTSEILNDTLDLNIEEQFGGHCFRANKFIRDIDTKLRRAEFLDEAQSDWAKMRFLLEIEIGRYYLDHNKPDHNETEAVRRIGRAVTQEAQHKSLCEDVATWVRLYRLGPAHLVDMPRHYMLQLKAMFNFAPRSVDFTLDSGKIRYLLQLMDALGSLENQESLEEEREMADALGTELLYDFFQALLDAAMPSE